MTDYRSPEAASYRRWYWTARWRRLAKAQLEAEPLCARCLREGRAAPATVCHHVEPHRGDEAKFWNGPFASSCKPCHDGAEQRDESRGYVVGVTVSGRPVDPHHPWNR